MHVAPSVKNLGVTLDCSLIMTRHFCRSTYIQRRQIGSICHLLTAPASQTLLCAVILHRLDYCNCLLAGCPQYLIDRLQTVQNAAARLIYKPKKNRLCSHWLPIRARIQRKISTLCFGVSTGTVPHTFLNFSICTLPLEFSVPPQIHAFPKFLFLIP